MAYDEQLADRVRDLLVAREGVTEKKMFGGIAFMIGGNMAVGVSGQGGLMLRLEPEEIDKALAEPHVRPFEMKGKPAKGWLRVDAEGVESDEELAGWVDAGADFAATLPPK